VEDSTWGGKATLRRWGVTSPEETKKCPSKQDKSGDKTSPGGGKGELKERTLKEGGTAHDERGDDRSYNNSGEERRGF